MHTTLSSKRYLPTLLVTAILLAGCGITTKKTFLDEPVQHNAGTSPPMSSSPGQTPADGLSRNPALDSGEATGVKRLLHIITPYQIDIQQGNFVSQEMLARIQPGMAREQVRFALGTPLLTDIFHSNRWDYIFRLQKPDGKMTNNRVVIYFENNRVARIIHDPLLNETQYLEIIAGPPSQKKKGKKEVTDTAAPKDTVSGDVVAGHEDTPSVTDSAQTETLIPVAADTPETTPKATIMTETVSETAETNRITPTITGSQETTPFATQAEEITSHAPQEPRQPVLAVPTVPETREKHPLPAENVRTVPALTPIEPTRQAAPKKPATTVSQDTFDEPHDDFQAAPRSTMQLHQLMQPQ
jgi:outer membrane protein assembly factor BamE